MFINSFLFFITSLMAFISLIFIHAFPFPCSAKFSHSSLFHTFVQDLFISLSLMLMPLFWTCTLPIAFISTLVSHSISTAICSPFFSTSLSLIFPLFHDSMLLQLYQVFLTTSIISFLLSVWWLALHIMSGCVILIIVFLLFLDLAFFNTFQPNAAPFLLPGLLHIKPYVTFIYPLWTLINHILHVAMCPPTISPTSSQTPLPPTALLI